MYTAKNLTCFIKVDGSYRPLNNTDIMELWSLVLMSDLQAWASLSLTVNQPSWLMGHDKPCMTHQPWSHMIHHVWSLVNWCIMLDQSWHFINHDQACIICFIKYGRAWYQPQSSMMAHQPLIKYDTSTTNNIDIKLTILSFPELGYNHFQLQYLELGVYPF